MKEVNILNLIPMIGWQAIHEAAREGHTHIVQLLMERGADVGAVTQNFDTVLSLARSSLDENHSLILFLEEIGAPEAQQPDEDMEPEAA